MSGVQGFQGFQGSGVQGNQGFQGFQGSGFQGVQGFQGNIGFQGSQGNQGSIGFQGSQGNQGFQGLSGVQGNQGNVGIQGFQGFQGFQGLIGLTGAGVQGPQGFQGNIGIQGFQGTGVQGFVGIQGLIGVQGLQGELGFQGFQGFQGSGIQGVQGISGFQGFQGFQGSGIQGLEGFQGFQGVAGSQGSIGNQGGLGFQGIQGPGISSVSGATSQVPFFSSTTSLSGSSFFLWNDTTKGLGIGNNASTNAAALGIDVSSYSTDGYALRVIQSSNNYPSGYFSNNGGAGDILQLVGLGSTTNYFTDAGTLGLGSRDTSKSLYLNRSLSASAPGLNGMNLVTGTNTFTDNANVSSATNWAINVFNIPTVVNGTFSGVTTYTNGYNLYISGAPIPQAISNPSVITYPYALAVATGNVVFGTGFNTNANFLVSQPTTGIGTVTYSGTTISGTNTQFTNTFKIGDTITIGSTAYTISAISSDTVMTANTTGSTSTGQSYTLTGGARFNVYGNGNIVMGNTSSLWYDARYGALNIGTATQQSSYLLNVNGASNINIASGITATYALTINSAAGSNLSNGILINGGYIGNGCVVLNTNGSGHPYGMYNTTGSNISAMLGGSATGAFNMTTTSPSVLNYLGGLTAISGGVNGGAITVIDSSTTPFAFSAVRTGSGTFRTYNHVMNSSVFLAPTPINSSLVDSYYYSAGNGIVWTQMYEANQFGSLLIDNNYLAGGVTKTGFIWKNTLAGNLIETMRLSGTNLSIGGTSPSSMLQVFLPVTGTGTVTYSGTTITGAGTQFTNTFKIGDTITIGSTAYTISAISSDTVMTANTTGSTSTGQSYTTVGGTVFGVYGNGNTIFSGGLSWSPGTGTLLLNNMNPFVISNTNSIYGQINLTAYQGVNITQGGLLVKANSFSVYGPEGSAGSGLRWSGSTLALSNSSTSYSIYLNAGIQNGAISSNPFYINGQSPGSPAGTGGHVYLTGGVGGSGNYGNVILGYGTGKIGSGTMGKVIVGTTNTDNGTGAVLQVSGAISGNPTGLTAGLIIIGNNTIGGTSYCDFLKVTNNADGATNSSKTFRTDISGNLQIINSSYSAQILQISDSGNVTIPGSLYSNNLKNIPYNTAAGTAVSMDNLNTRVNSGTGYLELSPISGTFTWYGPTVYTVYGNAISQYSQSGQSISSGTWYAVPNAGSPMSLSQPGDMIVSTVATSTGNCYRVTALKTSSSPFYAGITIERLY